MSLRVIAKNMLLLPPEVSAQPMRNVATFSKAVLRPSDNECSWERPRLHSADEKSCSDNCPLFAARLSRLPRRYEMTTQALAAAAEKLYFAPISKPNTFPGL